MDKKNFIQKMLTVVMAATLCYGITACGKYKDEWERLNSGVDTPAEEWDGTISTKYFPDQNFRHCLLELKKKMAIDGAFTKEDIAGITRMDVQNEEISSLKGIEYFTALEDLVCSFNNLTELDVSKNTKLSYLKCSNNKLTTLDISKNAKLVYLNCSDNKLTSLNVSNMALISLNCSYNGLTSLDVSNTAIGMLDNGHDESDEDGVVWYDSYWELDCSNNKLTSLDVSKNTALASLYCSNNELTTLDVSKNTALASLYCSNNELTTLDVSKNTALKSLACGGNGLMSLDVSRNTALTYLYCNNNELTTLDVSKNTTLGSLYCGGNELTSLDVSKNTKLSELYCYGNRITSLDVSNTTLAHLQCYGNQIKEEAMEAIISSLPQREEGRRDEWHYYDYGFYVYNNENGDEGNVCTMTQVAAVSEKGWRPLYYEVNERQWKDYKGCDLKIIAENFPDANFRSWLFIQDFGADGVITPEEIKQIRGIVVGGRNISSLKGIEYFTALAYLDCSNNQLTTLDVSKNTALESLDCCNNQLMTLDVSKNTALMWLRCSYNQLTTLNVSNTALESLYCYCNQIKGAAMDALINSLPQGRGNYGFYVWNNENGNEGNVCTMKQTTAARDKGWRPFSYDYTNNRWVDCYSSEE